MDRYIYAASGDDRIPLARLLGVAVFFPCLWVVLLFRILHHLLFRFRPRSVGKLLAYPIFVVYRIIGIALGIELDLSSHIGAGLFINHFGGIIIGPVRIGENCNVSHGVTLGRSTRLHQPDLVDQPDTPTLGNRVWIGPGAVVAGPIVIGDDAVVAGNSLVTRDVPPRGLAMGVPAKVVSLKGSFSQVSYRDMARDPDRTAALLATVDGASR